MIDAAPLEMIDAAPLEMIDTVAAALEVPDRKPVLAAAAALPVHDELVTRLKRVTTLKIDPASGANWTTSVQQPTSALRSPPPLPRCQRIG